MKPEDKQLLLKDLCARLPSYVKVETVGDDDSYTLLALHPNKDMAIIGLNMGYAYATSKVKIDTIKPYLRPMSSMAEEEKKELKVLCEEDLSEFAGFIRAGHGLSHDGLYMFDKMRQLEWLLKNHFDYRGLIEKGLAIEVTEDNNPYKILEL